MPKRTKAKSNQHDHSFSSPNKPPIACLYFRVHDQDSEEILFIAQPFGSIESAAYWLDELTLLDEEITTKRNAKKETVLIRHSNGHSLTILGVTDAIYSFSMFTNTYQPGPKDQSHLNRLKSFYKKPEPKPEPKKTEAKPAPQPKRHKSTKAVNGMITVAQMAESLNIQPNKARQILRKANIQKPPHGWSYKEGSKEAKNILKILKQ